MMKRPVVKKADATAKSLAPLIAEVRQLIHSARGSAASVVNTLQVMTNFEIGRRIVEHEQKGEKRAEYGDEVVKGLAQALTAEFGTGFSLTNLKLMRKFYLLFSSRIGQTPSDLSLLKPISQPASDQLTPQGFFHFQQTMSVKLTDVGKPQPPSAQLLPAQIGQTPSEQSVHPFTLSWSHYVLLLTAFS